MACLYDIPDVDVSLSQESRPPWDPSLEIRRPPVHHASFHHFLPRHWLSGLLRMVYRGNIADWVTALLSRLRCPVWTINRSINHSVIFGRRNIGSLFLNSQLLYKAAARNEKLLVDTPKEQIKTNVGCQLRKNRTNTDVDRLEVCGTGNKRIEGNAMTVWVSSSGSNRDGLQFYSAECLVNWPLNFLLQSLPLKGSNRDGSRITWNEQENNEWDAIEWWKCGEFTFPRCVTFSIGRVERSDEECAKPLPRESTYASRNLLIDDRARLPTNFAENFAIWPHVGCICNLIYSWFADTVGRRIGKRISRRFPLFVAVRRRSSAASLVQTTIS